MAQINKSDEYFNTKLYTGNNADGHAITGVGFQPDFLWIKCRNVAYSHRLYDSIRGVNSALISDQTAAENQYVDYGQLESFDSDGFTLGIGNTGGAGTNDGNNYVAWNWLASNTTASNTDGSITSTVSANTTSGFSIVSYTGTGANATVGHGLGVAPKVVLIKGRSTTYDWVYGGDNIGWTKYLVLNKTDASGTSSVVWNDTAPTSSVFSLGSNAAVNENTATQIAYCFAEKKGFSKFGSYTGNGNADGTFVYTGFKPSFVMHKRTDTTNNWIMQDNKRVGYNADNRILKANLTDAEQGVHEMDFVSNGFKIRTTGLGSNASGGTYIYMAFAENPLVGTNNIPATAR